jgi:hypothetical protein
LQKRRNSGCEQQGNSNPAQVLLHLWAEALCAKKPICDLIFCYLFYQEKSSSHSGNERLKRQAERYSSKGIIFPVVKVWDVD